MNSKSQNKAMHWKNAHVAWKRPVLNGLITDWMGSLWVTLIDDADVLNCELITREKCNSVGYVCIPLRVQSILIVSSVVGAWKSFEKSFHSN